MWVSIELGAEFYFDEDDYLSEAAKAVRQAARTPLVKGVKVESAKVESVKVEPPSPIPGPSFTSKGRKRPRRSAAVAVLSYATPGSDDENLSGEWSTKMVYDTKKKVRQETKLQLWIKHLSLLLKTETKKVSYSSIRGKACYTQTWQIIVHYTEKAIGKRVYLWAKGVRAKSLI